MDNTVAIVETCSQIIANFRVAHYSVIVTLGKQHCFFTSDQDIPGTRFVYSGRLIAWPGNKEIIAPSTELRLKHRDASALPVPITGFIENHLKKNRELLHHARFKHPTSGMFMVAEKTRREARKRRP